MYSFGNKIANQRTEKNFSKEMVVNIRIYKHKTLNGMPTYSSTRKGTTREIKILYKTIDE